MLLPSNHLDRIENGLVGLIGGVGSAVACLACLSALGLIGLWSTFIVFIAYFKYTYDLEDLASGRGSTLQNSQQIIFLLMICFLTIRFIKRQISKDLSS